MLEVKEKVVSVFCNMREGEPLKNLPEVVGQVR